MNQWLRSFASVLEGNIWEGGTHLKLNWVSLKLKWWLSCIVTFMYSTRLLILRWKFIFMAYICILRGTALQQFSLPF